MSASLSFEHRKMLSGNAPVRAPTISSSSTLSKTGFPAGGRVREDRTPIRSLRTTDGSFRASVNDSYVF